MKATIIQSSMKNFIMTFVVIPVLLFLLFNGVVFAILKPNIKESIIQNISIAKEKYSGKAEDALIAFLVDTTNSPKQRTRVAVWTLGEIKSQKALPLLKIFYIDDPSGVTCIRRHDIVLCQHGLHTAINAIESKSKMHPEFNK